MNLSLKIRNVTDFLSDLTFYTTWGSQVKSGERFMARLRALPDSTEKATLFSNQFHVPIGCVAWDNFYYIVNELCI